MPQLKPMRLYFDFVSFPEENERPLDLLKSLLFATLFQWAHISGFTQCISISDFLQYVRFSS